VFGLIVAGVGVFVSLFAPRMIWPVTTSLEALWRGADRHPLARLVEAALPLSIVLALARYRLWDVDTVTRRKLVACALTASIVGLYVLVVGALGVILQANGNVVVSLTAAGRIAVVFQPLREWLQRVSITCRADDGRAVHSAVPARLVSACEEERRRLRGDLHDELAPALAALARAATRPLAAPSPRPLAVPSPDQHAVLAPRSQNGR
jgi:signal transduction histidine kinase